MRHYGVSRPNSHLTLYIWSITGIGIRNASYPSNCYFCKCSTRHKVYFIKQINLNLDGTSTDSHYNSPDTSTDKPSHGIGTKYIINDIEHCCYNCVNDINNSIVQYKKALIRAYQCLTVYIDVDASKYIILLYFESNIKT